MYYYNMKTICDWNNCFELGEYRAPVEKDNSKNYRLLCLKHVKEFNQKLELFCRYVRCSGYKLFKIRYDMA